MPEPTLVTQIGAFKSATRTVQVTFTYGEIEHIRNVNAVVDGDGVYDADATAARVAEVGRGVVAKIEAGAIAAPLPSIDD